jgi:hypothetical protein
MLALVEKEVVIVEWGRRSESGQTKAFYDLRVDPLMIP